MTGEVRAGWELSLLPLAAALIPAAALRYDTCYSGIATTLALG
jgi:hypothetical protein